MAARIVLITGAGSGIGRACALRLAERGWHVWAGVRSASDTLDFKAPSITPILFDITQPGSIAAASSSIGPALAGLVNCAGITSSAPLELMPIEALRLMFEVNVFGHVAATQAMLPLLRVGRGRIVNIGSVAGYSTLPCFGSYSASKAAFESLTTALRQELALPVSLVLPGGVRTPIWGKSAARTKELLTGAPADLVRLYRPLIEAVERATATAAASAMPVSRVAAAVEHALTAAKPKTRYVVGRDAWLRRLLSAVPDRMGDWLIGEAIRRTR